jgi:hypothetical protein
LLGKLFEEKRHISYEKRAKNDMVIDKIKNMIVGDPEKIRLLEEKIISQ